MCAGFQESSTKSQMLEQHRLSLCQDFYAMGQERQNGGYDWISTHQTKGQMKMQTFPKHQRVLENLLLMEPSMKHRQSLQQSKQHTRWQLVQ
jgi:hypothetical protein